MALGHTPLIKSLRKLLRYGAQARAARIVERLSPVELCGLLQLLSSAERAQVLELALDSPHGREALTEVPSELLGASMAALSDARLATWLERLPLDTAAMMAEPLPGARRRAVMDRLGSERRERLDRAAPLGLFRQRLAAMFSMIG